MMEFETYLLLHVAVLWFVTPCSDVVGYQRFGGPWSLHH